MTAMHLTQFNGHGVADGDITVAGELKHPENVMVDAKFSKLALNYANVQLENVGPIHLRSSKESSGNRSSHLQRDGYKYCR